MKKEYFHLKDLEMYNIEGERAGHEPSNILFKSSKRLLEKKTFIEN